MIASLFLMMAREWHEVAVGIVKQTSCGVLTA